MRPIEYRAWHKSWSPHKDEDNPNKINGMYGVKGIWISNAFNKYVDLDKFEMGVVELWGWKSSCKIEEVVLMQYTGLKDKNGKKIFEGDIIINSNKEQFIIIWHAGGLCAIGYRAFIDKKYLKETSWYLPYSLENMGFDKEVIGNIYENKNLLKG